MDRMNRLKSDEGTLIPLTIVLAMAILVGAFAGSIGVRIALAYIQTSHVADTYAIHAAHRAANGQNGCADVADFSEFRIKRCHDDGDSVELALGHVASAGLLSIEVIGRARIGYQKYATEGIEAAGLP
jgi:hypothetical protein